MLLGFHSCLAWNGTIISPTTDVFQTRHKPWVKNDLPSTQVVGFFRATNNQYQPKQWKMENSYISYLSCRQVLLKWWRFSQLPWQLQDKSAGLWKFSLRSRDLLIFWKRLTKRFVVQSSLGGTKDNKFMIVKNPWSLEFYSCKRT